MEGNKMTMTRGKITAARRSAQRFIKACDAALARLDEEAGRRASMNRARGEVDHSVDTGPDPHQYSYGSMETGTLRRASMDLTRSLADLRRRA
jgi:hypothetical protein